MKRPKSKVFRHGKDLINAAINRIELRSVAKQQEICDRNKVEHDKDAAWIQENRLILEINARHNGEEVKSSEL